MLDHPRVTEIHALHCGPFRVGRFATTAGFGLPGQDRGEVVLAGPEVPGAAWRLAAELGALATVALPDGPADLEQLVTDARTPDGPLARFVALQSRAREATVGVS